MTIPSFNANISPSKSEILKFKKTLKKIQSYKLSPAAGKKFLTYEGRNISDTMDLQEVKLIEEVLQNKNKLTSKNESSLLEHQDGLLIHGDCISACAFLKSQNIKVDLIYVDPPFASGTNYAKKILLRNGTKKGIKISDNTIGNEVLYGDSWKKEDYLNWFAHRLLAFKEVMSDDASIFVHIDWHIGHYVKILLDEIFGENNFRNEIIWFYPSGAEPNEQFNRKHDTIFWYSKSNSKWTFNYDDVVIPYTKEQEARFDQWDEEKKKWFYWNVNPRGERVKTFKKAGLSEYDVWNIGINATEIRDLGYQTAKPQKLLEKIISASSNKNMVVADFFSGSGVAAKVAHDLGRKFIACDIGTNAMQTSRDRLVKSGASFSIYKIIQKDSIEKTIQSTGNKPVKKSVAVQSNDEVEIELKKNKSGFQVTVKKYFSPYLFSKLQEFKEKKKKKAQRKNEGEHQFNFNSLSEHGLELIEAIQFDTTLREDKIWISDLELEDKASIKEKIRGEYHLRTDQFKMKIRNIAGDEIIINSPTIK